MDDDEDTVHVVYAVEPHVRHRKRAPKCDIKVNGLEHRHPNRHWSIH